MDTVNGSFTSPLANANLRIPRDLDHAGLLFSFYNTVTGWNAVLILLLSLVVYDQCELLPLSSFFKIARRCLSSRAVSYKWQKGSLIGPAWKIPFMGPFLESVFPDFLVYKAKWASGTLSCVSVFHKYV